MLQVVCSALQPPCRPSLPEQSPSITRSYVPDLTCYVQRQFDCSYEYMFVYVSVALKAMEEKE